MRMTENDTERISRAADRLVDASILGIPVAPVRDVLGADDIEAAYAVQQELTRRRLAAGGQVVGRKIGLTSPPVQRQLGVDQPDFGVLFAEMDVSNRTVVPSHRLLQPKVEAEIAFVLKHDVVDGPANGEDVSVAVDYAVAALEIVDSRIADWDITITDTIADNASSAMYVLSDRRLKLSEFSPREVPMQMYADGVLVSRGSGSLCLGDPLDALAWLARTAAEFGDPLRAGQLVLSGALGPMVPVTPGVRVRADLGPLGTVSATFSSTEVS
jgi:2-keto-4-pentenoate hydratase